MSGLIVMVFTFTEAVCAMAAALAVGLMLGVAIMSVLHYKDGR